MINTFTDFHYTRKKIISNDQRKVIGKKIQLYIELNLIVSQNGMSKNTVFEHWNHWIIEIIEIIPSQNRSTIEKGNRGE